MPDKAFIRRMEKQLRARRDALRRNVTGQIHQLGSGDERPVGDFADGAVDDEHGLVTTGLAEIESTELVHIEEALRRIQDGTYGICEHCGKPIPTARLEVLPHATLCVRCQEALESAVGDRRHVEHWARVSEMLEVDHMDSEWSDSGVDTAA